MRKAEFQPWLRHVWRFVLQINRDSQYFRPKHLAVLMVFILFLVEFQSRILAKVVEPGGTKIAQFARRQLAQTQPFGAQRYAELKDVPSPRVDNLNCHSLFHDNQLHEREIAKFYQQYHNATKSLGIEELLALSSNCEEFQTQRKYIMRPVHPEEEDFSLAFSILMYKDPGQVERLLRAIYRPNNYYCIHVDQKSPVMIRRLMEQIAKCFDNVIMARRSSDVVWGFYSVLEPELTCMEDLWRFKKWRYFINLTGQEFPLKTNLDLVRIMKAYNGANDIPGMSLASLPARFLERVQLRRTPEMALENRTRKPDFPLWLNFTKGSVHLTASRAFVDFVLHNPIAKVLRDWMNDTFVADAIYFSTMNHNPRMKAPGGYTGGPPMAAFTINRYKMWRHTGRCQGKFLRYICIPGIGDLPALGQSRELFINKMEDDYQPFVYDCLEELHYNRTREDIVGISRLSPGFYENLPFVLHARRNVRSARDWTLTDRELEDWRRDTIQERLNAPRQEGPIKIAPRWE